jgi:hypothetical protein
VNTIASLVIEILKRDLPRETRFQSAESVSFDFGRNQVAVEGRTNFAASSMVLLKNGFHLALLLASLEHEYFRYPRLALFDNVEDKGMEVARSHNFQSVVVELSEQASVDHQIILTTSMMNPTLEDDSYVIGPAYDHQRKSLDI